MDAAARYRKLGNVTIMYIAVGMAVVIILYMLKI